MVKGLRKAKNVAPQAAGCYMLPLEYSATSEEPVVRAADPSCCSQGRCWSWEWPSVLAIMADSLMMKCDGGGCMLQHIQGASTCCMWQYMERGPSLCCKSTCWCGPQNVLVAGWGDQNFMIALLHSMDQELPKDSRVTLLNMRPKEQVLGVRPLRLAPLRATRPSLP